MVTDLILLALTAAYVAVAIAIGKPGRWRKKKRGLAAHTAADNRAWLSEALESLNCKVEWTTENDGTLGRFDFQGGHFGLRLDASTPYATLSYLFFLDTTQDNIELVRTLCNQCNLNSGPQRIVYTVNTEHNSVDVHILSSLLVDRQTAQDVLERAMTDCFQWRNAFVKRFGEMEEESGKGKPRDVEKDGAEWSRELFLLREQEMMHQEAGPDWRQNRTAAVTVRQAMASLGGIGGFLPIRMRVVCGSRVERVDTGDIKDYDLSRPLVADGRFIAKEALVMLDYHDQRRPDKERSLTIHLKAEGTGGHTLYYRITLTVVPLSAQPVVPMDSIEQETVAGTALVGYDGQSAEQQLGEFRYMWKDACQKHRNGQDDELTEEQRLIARTANGNAAFDLYFGHKLFLEGRYLEASLHLENAWRRLQPDFTQMNDSTRERFFEICYYLGFCFNELHQYEKAFFYLEQTLPMQRVTYTEEYVNCLVNSHDFRALPFITRMLNELEMMESMDDDGDDDDATAADGDDGGSLTSFKSFLKRRKAFVLIDNGRFDEAESILKALLDDPDSSDYALNELAYLQKLKK